MGRASGNALTIGYSQPGPQARKGHNCFAQAPQKAKTKAFYPNQRSRTATPTAMIRTPSIRYWAPAPSGPSAAGCVFVRRHLRPRPVLYWYKAVGARSDWSRLWGTITTIDGIIITTIIAAIITT